MTVLFVVGYDLAKFIEDYLRQPPLSQVTPVSQQRYNLVVRAKAYTV